MTPEQRIQQLEHELAALKAEVIGRRGADTVPSTDVEIVDRPTSRRNLLRLGAAGAGAAVAGTAFALGQATPAAAAGETFYLGQNQGTDAPTQANLTGSTDGAAFGFQSGTEYATSTVSHPAALAAWAAPDGAAAITNGLFAYTAKSGAGVVAVGGGAGSVGLHAIGERAALQLEPSTAEPESSTDPHERGEIVLDAYGNLWVCMEAGTPGTWRNLTRSSFTPVTPYRAYDSRWSPAPTDLTVGPLTSGSRVVSLTDARDLLNGNVVAADRLPAYATGVAFNLTVAEYSGVGFLAVAEGDAAEYASSTINFGPSNIGPIANGSSVKIDASNQVKVFIGGDTPSTHFIIDVVGYYY